MKRRDLLKSSAAFAALSVAPGFSLTAARAQGSMTFTSVPQSDLASIDPIWTTAMITAIHSNCVFDTLYGLDSKFQPQLQMLESGEPSEDGLTWTLVLRDGLKWHDGEMVTAEDCVASIKRWWVRDTLGQTLASVTDTLEAADEKTIVFTLNRPFSMLPNALAKPSGNMCAMMPARLAATSPHEQIPECIGSGPFKFMADEWVSGSKVVYEKFEDYIPREEPGEYTAGAKIAYVDRVEWPVINDSSTAYAALKSAEVDSLEAVAPDFVSIVTQDPDITSVARALFYLCIIRFNHLQPPFDNQAIRQAVASAVDQEAFMTAIFGEENKASWATNVGYFTPGTPNDVDAGKDKIGSLANIDAAKQAIIDAGYDGTPVVVLDPSDQAWIHAGAMLTANLLEQLGMNVDLQTMDWGTMMTRRPVKGTPDEGGWNVFVTSLSGPNNLDPAGHLGLRGNGGDAWFGWPDNPEMEEMRMNWFFAEDAAERTAIIEKIQETAFDKVPYVPMGAYTQITAYTKDWVDMPKEMPLYYTMKPAG
ncbi:ABC transporter substrate-binding protein [Pseudooceanicola sp. 502str34]|uniref:ABC transporter substrate-binding protein n=1 Tax=Maritimibacter alkaliphilus TaxID=404236 RepID=UPI001C94E009|nr:ABC transporter substrate-binding protein [Maritimibacter alkaliphilus]MBY6089781.1 ABC transporter substrate-binding protein [Maritimibacter alkaliphilus]